jgi:hypothetical protein
MIRRRKGQTCGGVYGAGQILNPRAPSTKAFPVFNPVIWNALQNAPQTLKTIAGSGTYTDPETGKEYSNKKQFMRELVKQGMTREAASKHASDHTSIQTGEKLGVKIPKKKIKEKQPYLKKDTGLIRDARKAMDNQFRKHVEQDRLFDEADPKKLLERAFVNKRGIARDAIRRNKEDRKNAMDTMKSAVPKKILRKRITALLKSVPVIKEVNKAEKKQMKKMISPIEAMAERTKERETTGLPDAIDLLTKIAEGKTATSSRKERADKMRRSGKQKFQSKQDKNAFIKKAKIHMSKVLKNKPKLRVIL